jgi:hypothetical protein
MPALLELIKNILIGLAFLVGLPLLLILPMLFMHRITIVESGELSTSGVPLPLGARLYTLEGRLEVFKLDPPRFKSRLSFMLAVRQFLLARIVQSGWQYQGEDLEGRLTFFRDSMFVRIDIRDHGFLILTDPSRLNEIAGQASNGSRHELKLQ